MNTILDILIPTYNRSAFLNKNLDCLSAVIKNAGLREDVAIIVSNNGSEDDTRELLDQYKFNCEVAIYHQNHNIGALENSEFVLSKSTSRYCMFLGDDDFLHPEYLPTVIQNLRANTQLTYIVSSFYTIHPDGNRTSHRGRMLGEPSRKYSPGANAIKELALLAHQISGLVFKRECFTKRYFHINMQSMYPFIFFAIECCKTGESLLLTEYPVKVTELPQSKKYWSYGDDGLLIDKFKCIYWGCSEDSRLRYTMEMKILSRYKYRMLEYLVKGFYPYCRLYKALLGSAYISNRTKSWLLLNFMLSPVLTAPFVAVRRLARKARKLYVSRCA